MQAYTQAFETDNEIQGTGGAGPSVLPKLKREAIRCQERWHRPGLKPAYVIAATQMSAYRFKFYSSLPQQFLYFLPLPQGQGSFLPIFSPFL